MNAELAPRPGLDHTGGVDSSAPHEIVGRDEELNELRSFAASSKLGGALLVEGEAGIGKTTVWLAGVAAARDTGARVLCARPVETEAKLSFTGVADLLAEEADSVLARLPEPQRRALAKALIAGDYAARAVLAPIEWQTIVTHPIVALSRDPPPEVSARSL